MSISKDELLAIVVKAQDEEKIAASELVKYTNAWKITNNNLQNYIKALNAVLVKERDDALTAAGGRAVGGSI